jgi:hypothetical protein
MVFLVIHYFSRALSGSINHCINFIRCSGTIQLTEIGIRQWEGLTSGNAALNPENLPIARGSNRINTRVD